MAGPGRPRRAGAAVPAAAVAAVAALAAGCTGGPARAAPPASPRPAAQAGPVPTALATGAQRRHLAARYLAIAKAGNRRLEAEFGRLRGPDRARLAAAHRDLRQIAATERRFDQQLLGLAFPAATERTARFLYWANQERASTTGAAASASSLARLRAAEHRMALASKPVEQAVAMIRSQLGLPPPETS